MADVKPFRALRYDEGRAGRLEDLVAPPYDVISPEERLAFLERSPYNVVHLTLPNDEREAARLWRAWQEDGVVVRDDEPVAWVLVQDYVGPDGVARSRAGLVVSLRAEPYERRVVLPHERTHRGPKEGRLRLLRAVRAQLEPIFLLHEGPPLAVPEREPDLEVVGARLWRVPDADLTGFATRELLIADGHHRYETALAFHAEDGGEASGYLLAVLVSTREQGLTIFPTHRVAARASLPPVEGRLEDALAELEAEPRTRAAVVAYTKAGAALLRGEEGQLDPALVETFAPEDVRYTPAREQAVAAVDTGEAEAAFLLRPALVEQVWEVARGGEVMPQKSTYFFPKLVSGLLFHPL